MGALFLQLADIVAAARRIEGGVKRTPCRHTRINGLDLYLKFDNR